jgi:hypothetical protein
MVLIVGDSRKFAEIVKSSYLAVELVVARFIHPQGKVLGLVAPGIAYIGA